ncbi:MAG TPA: chemotaxis response regulator protein-glutamate methylesterase [Terriglobales bacterium]
MNKEKHERPIRVMVVDDSAFMRTAISRMITSDASLEVAGSASDGQQALEMLQQIDPDVITMDVEMPRMNGLEALRKIMEGTPRPVIMISSVTQEGAQMTLDALESGAFDYIPKQLSYVSLDIVKIKQDLVNKIKAAAASRRCRTAKIRATTPRTTAGHAPLDRLKYPSASVVCIGTSTGGPKALQRILPMLPAELPAGVVIVQHMPPGFTGPFASRLNGLCRIRVKEAEQDDWIEPGTALIAPAGLQTTIYRKTHSRFAIRLSTTPSDTLHVPSVDVMMLSAAEVLGPMAMGVIMTGMGNDGERGIKAIQQAGGFTVGQDEASCAVYGMPRACALGGSLSEVVSLEGIPDQIVNATRCRPASTGTVVCPSVGVTRI